jgi:hypothetical protein
LPLRAKVIVLITGKGEAHYGMVQLVAHRALDSAMVVRTHLP